MAALSISQVARQAGVRTSAIRYYESIGLLPLPPRRSGHRYYDEGVLQRLAIIHTAQQAGFTLAEMRLLFNDILTNPAPTPHWQALIQRKLQEMNTMLANIQSMKGLLEAIMQCDDPELADCIYQTGQQYNALA